MKANFTNEPERLVSNGERYLQGEVEFSDGRSGRFAMRMSNGKLTWQQYTVRTIPWVTRYLRHTSLSPERKRALRDLLRQYELDRVPWPQ